MGLDVWRDRAWRGCWGRSTLVCAGPRHVPIRRSARRVASSVRCGPSSRATSRSMYSWSPAWPGPGAASSKQRSVASRKRCVSWSGPAGRRRSSGAGRHRWLGGFRNGQLLGELGQQTTATGRTGAAAGPVVVRACRPAWPDSSRQPSRTSADGSIRSPRPRAVMQASWALVAPCAQAAAGRHRARAATWYRCGEPCTARARGPRGRRRTAVRCPFRCGSSVGCRRSSRCRAGSGFRWRCRCRRRRGRDRTGRRRRIRRN